MQRTVSTISDTELTPDGSKRKSCSIISPPEAQVQFLDQRTQSSDSDLLHRDKRWREEERDPATPPVVFRKKHSFNTPFRHPSFPPPPHRQVSLASPSDDSTQSDYGRSELASAFALASLARTVTRTESNASDSPKVSHQIINERHAVANGSLPSEGKSLPKSHFFRNHQYHQPVVIPGTPPVQAFRGARPTHSMNRPPLPPHALSSWHPGGHIRQMNTPYGYPYSNNHPFNGAPKHHLAPRPTQQQLNIPLKQQQNNTWICDFCNVAAFHTFEEASAHEKVCQKKGPSMTLQHRQPKEAERTDCHLLPSSESRVPSDEIREGNSQDVAYDALTGFHEGEKPLPPPSFAGSVPLSVTPSDKEWLSDVNCYIRSQCVEAFSATEDDVVRTSKRGRITLNQVGIRCRFCSSRPMEERGAAAVSYPVSLMGIYESVKRWQKVHVAACTDMPAENREKLKQMQESAVWVPTSRQYWSESAKSLGMADTKLGIRFIRDPATQEHTHRDAKKPSGDNETKNRKERGGQLVLPEDKYEVSPYVFLLMGQVQPCFFTEADRFVARSKGPVGFPGFECRHCCGHAGLGKYFPSSVKGMCTNSTSQNIHSHLLKCRRCPPTVKHELEQLKTDKSKTVQLASGWRRRFFDKLWSRLHG